MSDLYEYVLYSCKRIIWMPLYHTLSTFHRQQRQKGHPIARLVNAVNHIERNHKKPISLALTGKHSKRVGVCLPRFVLWLRGTGVFQTIRIHRRVSNWGIVTFYWGIYMICKSMGWKSFQIHSNSGDFETLTHSRFRSCKNRCCDGFGLQRCTMILLDVSQGSHSRKPYLTNANQLHTSCWGKLTDMDSYGKLVSFSTKPKFARGPVCILHLLHP